MGGFNFFNISRNFLKEFNGLAGTKQNVAITLSFTSYSDNDPRPVITQKTIKRNCVITKISQQKLSFMNFGVETGRDVISVRIQNKKDILTYFDAESFEAMKMSESYVEWLGKKYTIFSYQDFFNADFIHFYCSFGGED